MKTAIAISLFVVIFSFSSFAQTKTVEIEFVNALNSDPIISAQVDLTINDSVYTDCTDSSGLVKLTTLHDDTIGYELFVFNRTMASGKLVLSDDTLSRFLIDVKVNLDLEEVIIVEDREPLIHESFGSIDDQNGGFWSKNSFPMMGFDGSLGGVHMTDGSTASFYNILKTER